MTIRAYIRISTDKQDEASQRQIIASAICREPVTPVQWITDTASGGTPWQKRGLASALDMSLAGDTIITSEISRIARSTVGVLSFLTACAERGVNVVAVKSGIKLDGSMSSKIVVTVLAMAAEIERDLLRERTTAALQARKARGLPVGRQPGALGKRNKLAGRESEVDHLIAAKVSYSAIARLMGCSRQTLHSFQVSRATAAPGFFPTDTHHE